MFRLLAVLALVCFAGSALAESAAPGDHAARAYTEKVAAGLAAKIPDRKFTVIGDFQIRRIDPGGGEAILSTLNSYSDYKANPGDLGRIVDAIVASLTDKAPVGARMLKRIVPVIKDRPWLEEARRGFPKGIDLIYEDYNEQLIVVYAIDTENRTRYLMSNEDVGDRRSLRARAVDNLSHLLPDVALNGKSGFWFVTAGGDYEASLLLFDKMWRSDKIKVDGEIVVAVPARNMLFVTGSNDREALAKLRKAAAEIVAESRYQISDELFVYRGGRFVKFERK